MSDAKNDDDIYVITSPGAVSAETAKRIEDAMTAKFPDKKFVMLGEGLHLYRVSTADRTS